MCDDLSVVRQAYDAFARRDFASLLTLLDPDVELEHPPGSPLSGVHRGHADVLAGFFVLLPVDPLRLATRPDGFRRDDGEVVVRGHHEGRNDRGERFEVPFVHRWTLSGGFVVRIRSEVDAARFATVVDLAQPSSGGRAPGPTVPSAPRGHAPGLGSPGPGR